MARPKPKAHRLGALVAVSLLIGLTSACHDRTDPPPAEDRLPASAHEIKDLLAGGPAPALAEDLKMFGQFVGDWDIRTETYLADSTARSTGSVHVGWILYGTALQDVWTGAASDPRPGYPQKSFGTTIRFFDDRTKVWRVVWIAPVERIVQTFVARETNGEIVLEGRTPEGGLERWIWSDYTPATFQWRSAESVDAGKTWKVTQRIWGTRHRASS